MNNRGIYQPAITDLHTKLAILFSFLFIPADNKWKNKSQSIIEIYIQFVVSVCRLERFNEEKIIKNNCDERPNDSKQDVALKRIYGDLLQ